MLLYLKRKRWAFLIATIGGIILPYFTCGKCSESFGFYIFIALYTFTIWATMWLGNEFIAEWLDEKIEWTKEPVKRLLTGIICMLVYTVSMVLIIMLTFEGIANISLGHGANMVYVSVFITCIVTLVFTSRSFLMNWRQSAVDAERLKKESITANYESLKNQVNPHFLFNSFNVLTNLVYEDQEKAVKFIKQLADVYRYVLDSREKEIVPLAEELKFLNAYVYLQQIRFGDKLHIDVALQGVVTTVAPLALQMLIENAVKHNVVSEESPLHIRIFAESGYIIIQNNMQKKSSLSEYSPGIGLENICKRYEFLSDKKVEVIKDNHLFTVKLPTLQ